MPQRCEGVHRQPAQGLGGHPEARRNAQRADRGELGVLHELLLGRPAPSLEDQALHPFLNPVEMAIVRTDPEYAKAFQEVFGKAGEAITMTEVTQAIAAFERTQVSGNSPFDLFVNQGRCVSCHVMEQTTALFTDNLFHNVGVGINDIQKDVPELAGEFLAAKATLAEVDVKVLTDKRTSELGTFRRDAVLHYNNGGVTNEGDPVNDFLTMVELALGA